MRRAAPVLAALLALLVAAAPASADDEYEIDERLVEAGYEDAYTGYTNADDGVRVLVDYRTGSVDEAGYQQEAADIARLVWLHLELRVLAVDIAPASAVSWLDGGLPPAVSFSRGELEQRFGPRPARLDVNETSWLGDDDAGLAFVGLGAVVLLVVGVGLGFLFGFLLGRRRRSDPWGGAASGPWGGAPGQWGAPAPAGAWGAPAGAWGGAAPPGTWGGAAPPGTWGGAAPPPTADPWRPQ